MSYDSYRDTEEHIHQVRLRLRAVSEMLETRGWEHDASKLEAPEKPIFDEMTPKLKELAYGSPEYKESLAALGPALTHHYANNSHHPEHYPNGVAGMCLLDLVEMYCDWQAAALRTKGGDFAKSLSKNADRFKMDPQLSSIFLNMFERHGDLTALDRETGN